MDIIHAELSRDFETVEILSLGDLHVGASSVDYQLFHKFIKYVLAKPNRFIIYNGDNMNNALKNSKGNAYGEVMRPREQKKFLIEHLEPVKDRILVFNEGNHEARTTKDTDQCVVEDIAMALGKGHLFREDEALIKLTFGTQKNKKRQCYSIWCSHGSGGGGTPGTSLNKLEKVALGIHADCFIMNHVHKKMAYKNSYRWVDLKNNKVITKERLFVIASHWLDFAGYPAKLLLTPSAKGSVPIIFHAKEKKMEAII